MTSIDNNAITKEYKVNESVLVTYHTLESLYQHFFPIYPKKIGDKIVGLLNDLKDDLTSEMEKDFIDHDISDYYYEKVAFVKCDEEKEEN